MPIEQTLKQTEEDLFGLLFENTLAYYITVLVTMVKSPTVEAYRTDIETDLFGLFFENTLAYYTVVKITMGKKAYSVCLSNRR
jgi:hypothetical protein